MGPQKRNEGMGWHSGPGEVKSRTLLTTGSVKQKGGSGGALSHISKFTSAASNAWSS